MTVASGLAGQVLVVGSINVDMTLRVERSPHAGETVIAASGHRGLGGKGANQAAAARRAGASVRMIGSVGDDADGHYALTRFRTLGVLTDDVRVRPGQNTGFASIALAATGENRIIVLSGANATFEPRDAVESLGDATPRDVLVVQGEVPADVTVAAMEAAERRGTRTVLNLAPFVDLGDSIRLATHLVVNEVEVSALIGASVTSASDVIVRVDQISRRHSSVIVTVGAAGAIVVRAGVATHIEAPHASEVIDTTGAGDAFAGVLAARLSARSDLMTAVHYGVRCATAAVGVLGAADSYPDFTEAAMNELQSR